MYAIRSYYALNDNIINGRIRGVAGVVGCVNPRVKQDWVHVELVKELIKNDVLVVQTGCSQISLAKAGLCTPEAAHLAGPGRITSYNVCYTKLLRSKLEKSLLSSSSEVHRDEKHPPKQA